MGAARDAAHSQQAGLGRDRGVLSVARGGDQRSETGDCRRAGGDGGASTLWESLSRDSRPWTLRAFRIRAARPRHGSSVVTVASPRRSNTRSRDPAFHRRFAPSRGAVEIMGGAVPRSAALKGAFTWLAVTIATVVVLAVGAVIVALWTNIGDSEISVAGWLAMGLGVTVTLGLGVGLMALVFISSRRGYDELGRGRDDR